MHGADVGLFHWINGWSDSYSPFYVFLSEGSKSIGVRIALAILALLMIGANPQTRKAALLALLAVPLANGLTDVLKHSFPVLRPCVELGDVILRVGRLDSPGTASAHAANMAAIAFIFTWVLEFWGLVPIFIALFTGVSRIYVGVHYPSQVLVGWLVGLMAGLIVMAIYKTLEHRYLLHRAETDARKDALGDAGSRGGSP